MCYLVLLSTSSDVDLSAHDTELVRFSRDVPGTADADSLKYRNRWYVGSKSGCSCTFRHLHSTELGFGAPVDWYPEEPEELSATLQLIALIRGLVRDGESVDLIDIWEHHDPLPIATELLVDLAGLSDEEFRMFENHHFIFSDSAHR